MMKLLVTYMWQGEIDGIPSAGSGICVLEAPKQLSCADDFIPIMKSIKKSVEHEGMGVEETVVHIVQVTPLSSVSPGFSERHPVLAGAITGALFGLTFWAGAGLVYFLQ